MTKRQDSGTITEGSYHPAADAAMVWVKDWLRKDPLRTAMTLESFASVALSGDDLAEICNETLRRIVHGENVSDRYLLGLAWTLRDIEERRDG